jgi:hypothetical protein
MKGERILVSAKFNDQMKRSERRAKSSAEFAKRAGRIEQEAKAGDSVPASD